MTTSTILALNEERLSALVDIIRTLPEPMQRLLESQAEVLRAHETHQAEARARLEEERAERDLAIGGLRAEKAALESLAADLGAANVALKEDVARAVSESAALRDEREAFLHLEAAYAQFIARKRVTDAILGVTVEEVETDAAPTAVETGGRPDEQQRELSPGEAAPVLPKASAAPEEQPTEETAEAPVREIGLVVILPATTVVELDALVAAGRFASRESFAERAIIRALEACHGPISGRPAGTARGASRTKGEA
jgi:hypothetical protein